MYRREISIELLKRINEPRHMIQVLAGPRQVGKTFAVKQALENYNGSFTYRLAEGLVLSPLVWLENEWNAARLAAKADGEHLLVIDEIQKISDWSDMVKRLWDEDSFYSVKLKVVLLGSSRLLLQKGLNESLQGRFELLEASHWSYQEMCDAFGFSVNDYILYGGYPGSITFIEDENRWKTYIRESIAEPSISNDILQMEQVVNPALLKQMFHLGCTYSARILSYQKMLGQLQDAGNATTLAHYLKLLGEAGLVCGLEKFYEEVVRLKASSPKLSVCNNALLTALSPNSFNEIRSRTDIWGHFAESAIGAHLQATAKKDNIEVHYWNVGAKEVDFVLRKGQKLAGIEVKSGLIDDISGMKEFLSKYPRAKPYLVGGPGMSYENFFTKSAADFL